MHEVWSVTQFNHPARDGYYIVVLSQREDNYESHKKLCLIVLIQEFYECVFRQL